MIGSDQSGTPVKPGGTREAGWLTSHVGIARGRRERELRNRAAASGYCLFARSDLWRKRRVL